jgi:hypothetical protein
VSEMDYCVSQKSKDGRIFIVLLYVDGILVIVDEGEAAVLKKLLM